MRGAMLIPPPVTFGVPGHLNSSGAMPTASANANIGNTGTATITEGNDFSFRLRIVPNGAGIAIGTVCTVTFAAPYPGTSYGVIVGYASNAARSLATQIGPTNRGTTSVDLDSRTALTAGSTYDFDVQIVYRS